MSKLTQIEQALVAIDPAGFQRLCDAYLHARGYDRINPIGLVIGADKVKRGTPDTLVPMSDGSYAFAEYTTQAEGVADKLLRDMDKCFDESKTGIPVDRIREFVACHTSVLPSADEHKLVEAGRRRGCMVSLFGIGPISHDLLQRYPGLARDFLGVEVDTGQIVSIDEFVSSYSQNALATPLDTTIRFRDEEIQQGLTALESGDLLIIAGPPGVGKSRLALECCRQFVEKHDLFSAKAVYYRGADLFEDVRVYFSAPDAHLVFVDDANRVSGFDYILHLLHEQTEDRRVKIVATVRDYALEKVLEAARPYGGALVLRLTALKDEQIRKIVSDDFGIGNHLYLDRIERVARGNPRIAVMMARVAARENTLESIADVSALYDEYFKSIRKDLTDLDDAELLRAAGILTFLRNVDRKNGIQMQQIVSVFGVETGRFWSAVRRLNDLEVVDLYEDEVARMSDQVLATFVFHLAFFKERALDPGALFHPLMFPTNRSQIFDALNPALEAFDAFAIGKRLLPILQRRWRELEETDDEAGLLHLVDAFGPLDPTATLTFVRDRVNAMTPEAADLSAIVFKASAGSRPSLWSILAGFRNADVSMVRIALVLAAKLVANRPQEVPEALSLFADSFGMKHTSYTRGVEVERAAIDILWDHVCKPKDDAPDPLFLRLFCIVAEPLLRTHFDTHESRNERSITIMRFDVPVTPELKELRATIWTHIAGLLQGLSTRASALEVIRHHASSGHNVTNGELLLADAAIILPAFAVHLNPDDYTHCATVQAYLQLLKQHRVELGIFAEDLQRCFGGPTYQLAVLLTEDYADLEERAELGWQEYQQVKNQRLAKYIEEYGIEEFDRLISQCLTIREDLRAPQGDDGALIGRQSRDDFQLRAGVGSLFQVVASRDPDFFEEIVRRYLARGNPLELGPHGIVSSLVATRGADRTYAILNEYDFSGRGFWHAAFFMIIPEEAVTEERVEALYALYDSAAPNELVRDMDYLAKYEHADPRVVRRVTAKLVERTQNEPAVGVILADALDGQGEVGGRVREIFGGSEEGVTLLKNAYLAASRPGSHLDYHAATFGLLLDLDPTFGAMWVDWMYEHNTKKDWLSHHDDSRDYSSLWLREDVATVMRRILERVRGREPKHFSQFSYGRVFLRVVEGNKDRIEIQTRQDEVFDAWVCDRAGDANEMGFVFALASEFAPERRRRLLAAFVERNPSFEAFRQLELEPNQWSWSGSQVPMLQKRVEFFESLLPLFATIELLDHRRMVEKRIEYLRKEIEQEKRSDFLEN